MRFFIVDDDPAVRSMLETIIEDEQLGTVAGDAPDGSHIDHGLLASQRVDVLLIDLLMPGRDGIETVRELAGRFEGKIVMISQIESKELIGKAYAAGIEYYVTKPINRLEVVAVLRKVAERLRLQHSIRDIRKTLSAIGFDGAASGKGTAAPEKTIVDSGSDVLSDLGLVGEAGVQDLLDILEVLSRHESERPGEPGFPQLLDLYRDIARRKLGPSASEANVKREVKAAEQRVRRAVHQALVHVASLGLIDYASPKFEQYATVFFDLGDIRKKMKELEDETSPAPGSIRQNTKKFIQALYLESKKRMA
ncbi:response regulator [Paenibacillus flagellatus]|uniref:Transcriptional regulator n=1 Tax=Paenibacillus flagellatus TaxID=2211139 RepID=A0A2V5KM30_9BACL|nr:response regulator [Paenibacillus flagellatus]PYI51947.1 transcriptional regulator [Paenibacillus flagellatus]